MEQRVSKLENGLTALGKSMDKRMDSLESEVRPQIATIYERTNHLTDGQKRIEAGQKQIENRLWVIGVTVVIIPILSDFVARYILR